MAENGGTVALVGQLLQTHTVPQIVQWLEGRAKQKTKVNNGKNSEQSWEEFQLLRPHFATSFTDFLLKDCQHLLGEEPPPVSGRPQASQQQWEPPPESGARRQLGVHTVSAHRAADGTPETAGRGRGGRARRGGPRSEPRDTGRPRQVPLTELVVSEGRAPRRGRRSGGRGCREPAQPAPDGTEEVQGDGAAAREETSFVTPQKQRLSRGGVPARAAFQAAVPAKVSQKQRLDGLAILYAYLVNRHHLLGLSIELNFLIRLLVAPGWTAPTDAAGDYSGPALSGAGEHAPLFITSIHNAVFFSTATLWLIRDQLLCLDTANLRLLATNDRLQLFRPDLSDALLAIESPCLSPPPGVIAADDEQPPDSLAFYSELVYRSNFPSDATFNAFRRQHDLFHSLVSRWGQASEAASAAEQADWLGEGARALVALCPHPVNMHHLARLYQARLLQLGGDPAEEADDQPVAAVLEQADRIRLQRLSDRFLRPTQAGRAGGRRHFPGAQELFRQVLARADSAALAAALRELLSSSVLQLDAQPLPLPEAGAVLPETVRQVSERIFRLRLLAKFLGLVTFRGLHSDEEVPEQVLTSSIQQRNRLPPPLDLLGCLQAAVRRRHLVTTLPWVIEYLCMMDRVSVLTSAHQTVFSLLVRLFGSLSHAPGLTSHNALFLRLLYENLYEIHSHVQNLCDKDDATAIDRRAVEAVMAEFLRLYCRRPDDPSGVERGGVDARNVVRSSLLYVCCPPLGEQRLALLRYKAGRPHRPSPALRKIIPITAQPADSAATAARQTQAELEEGFFQSHHPSLRRTAAFVVERLASASIRRLRACLLPAETRGLLTPLMPQLVEKLQRGLQDHQLKSWLHSRLSELVLSSHGALVSRLAEASRSRAAPLVEQALGALLTGEDLTPGARRTCHLLVEAGVCSRVNCWLNANVTRNFVQHLLEEACRGEVRRLRRGKASSPTSSEAAEPEQAASDPLTEDLPAADAELVSPSGCLGELKDVLTDLLCGRGPVAESDLLALLERTGAVQRQWGRLLPSTVAGVGRLVTDLTLAVVSRYPASVTRALLTSLALSCRRLEPQPVPALLSAVAAGLPLSPAAASCLRQLLSELGASQQQLLKLSAAEAAPPLPGQAAVHPGSETAASAQQTSVRPPAGAWGRRLQLTPAAAGPVRPGARAAGGQL